MFFTRAMMTGVAIAGVLAVCSCDRNRSDAPGEATTRKGQSTMSETQTKTIAIRSSAFGQGQAIPKQYSGEGQNLSPPLRWSPLPAGTGQLAMIVDDPDAPRAEPFVHWVIYNIPATVQSLPEGVSTSPQPPEAAPARQGKNSAGTIGYMGPMPPRGHGVHHYHFRLYALDRNLDLESGLLKEQVLAAIQGHILAEGELVGTYERR